MNTIDYLLLAALAGGAIYTFYRLFLGYVSSWSRKVQGIDGSDYHIASRTADNTIAEIPTPSRERNHTPDRGVERRELKHSARF